MRALWYTNDMDDSKKKVLAYGAFGLLAVVILFAVLMQGGNRPASKKGGAQQQQKETLSKTETQRLLESDASDLSHVNNVAYIQAKLEEYYRDNKFYPKKISDMVPRYMRTVPMYSLKKGYLYATDGKDKAASYHVGTMLGGNNPADAKLLKEDADFNSEKAKYTDGFNGLDPVFDLVGGALAKPKTR